MGSGVVVAKDLHVDTGDKVHRVIGSNVLCGVGSANTSGVRHGHIAWVAVTVVDKSVDVLVVGETACKRVERPVLLHEDDDVLDIVQGRVNRACNDAEAEGAKGDEKWKSHR